MILLVGIALVIYYRIAGMFGGVNVWRIATLKDIWRNKVWRIDRFHP